jgi:mannosyl-oligosaccharide alpha-1,2-mannosidase
MDFVRLTLLYPFCRYRDWGWNVFQAFERHTKVNSGGYTSLDDMTVITAPKRDKMATFFLGETLKYLYLLFGDMTVLPSQFVFNTEAHPLPVVGGQQYGRFITRNHDH